MTTLGIVTSPKGEFTHENVTEAFQLVKQGGDITRAYHFWTEIETAPGVFKWPDYMVNQARNAGLRLTVAFHTIRTAIVGPRPADLVGLAWDDPTLIARFSVMLLAFLERYEDVVDYVEIGSEVNGYLQYHPNEIAKYRTFFLGVVENVKPYYPNVSFGMVFSYRALLDTNSFYIYDELAVGDHDGFTAYFTTEGFQHTLSPNEITKTLANIEAITGDRPYAIEEIGWSSSSALSSSERDQRRAVKKIFGYLNSAPDRLQFLNWFILHDGQKTGCDQIARTFFPPTPEPDPADLALLSEFLCTFGLRRNDGSEKPAWRMWMRQR